jgi:hypothetical protein
MATAVTESLLIICGPFAFGVFAAVLMFLLFDIVIFESGRKADWTLKRMFGVLSWFVGNEAIITGTLWAFDLPEAMDSPRAEGIAFLSYLTGFGLTGAILGLTGRRQLLHYHFSGLYPDLTYLETRAVLLVLRYSVSFEHAAEALDLTPGQLKKVYSKALSKMARKSE